MQRDVPAPNNASINEGRPTVHNRQPQAQASGVSRAEMAEAVQSDPRGMAERWLAENDEALRSSNDFVEKHGLPLAKYRRF
ncbi:MAG: type II toxin-antitoxin system CcdA family antitoxin [Alcaligenaceae bacterium]|nr:type II toxin-antitoxin system CcdA family antitoxin [Alcaligenaceae bacterium]